MVYTTAPMYVNFGENGFVQAPQTYQEYAEQKRIQQIKNNDFTRKGYMVWYGDKSCPMKVAWTVPIILSCLLCSCCLYCTIHDAENEVAKATAAART